MKYLITFIVIAIITFVTINAKKKPKSKPPKTTPPPSPPKWKNWNGTQPYSAKEIVKNATELYYNKTSVLFKLLRITLNQTRIINGTNRYRVKYFAARCVIKDEKKSQKSGKKQKNTPKKKPECFGTVKMETPFYAILKVNLKPSELVLNVTNLFKGDSYKKKYKRLPKKTKKLQ